MRLRRKLEGDPSHEMNFRPHIRGIRIRSLGNPVPEIPGRPFRRKRSQHFRKPRTSGWSLEGNGDGFYERVRLRQRGFYHNALSIILSEADGRASVVHGKVVLYEPISIGRIRNVQSSSEIWDKS